MHISGDLSGLPRLTGNDFPSSACKRESEKPSLLPFSLPLFFFLPPKQSYLPNDANQELAKDVNHPSRKAMLQTHLGCQPGHENEEMLGAGLSLLLSFSPFTHRHTGQCTPCPRCWGGEEGQGPQQGSWFCPELAPLRAGYVHCHVLWGQTCCGLQGLLSPHTCHGTCCDPRPAVGLQELPHDPPCSCSPP